MSCPDENALVGFAAGELSPDEHAAVLEHIDVCADCAAMVADAALAVGEPTGTEPTLHVSPGHGGPAPPLPGPLPRGTSLGRYVVLELLGTGGLGQVYTAYDPELDRRVAVKLLRPSARAADNVEAQRWLMREAQAMAQLSHPNVVPVHDVGTFGDEVFIAMKLVGGGTLRPWLSKTKRSWQEIRDVLFDAGRGLQAAHDAGLVHRDFKPANLLVDETGTAFVVDFGLARGVAGPGQPLPDVDPLAAAPDRLLGEDLTETGAIIGTPAYMALEQLTGREVDPRADQFAFCVTLYEALYGMRPFGGRSYAELRQSIEAGPVDPPSTATVPTWLRRAVLKGLAADASQRFATMNALLEAITVDRRSRRRQRIWIGGAAVLSAVVAGTLGFALQPEPTPAERDAVEDVVSAARDAASRAYFIYPPHDDPDYPTAYVRVLELESVEGAPADDARSRAQDLRDEFATTLVRLGDSYWDRRGGIAFASDYYAAAVIFDPSQQHARERMLMTPGQLGALSQRAAGLSFSDGELTAAEALVALAEPDDGERRRKVEALKARAEGPTATHTQLSRLFGEPARETPDVVVAVAEPGTGEPAEATPPDDAASARKGRTSRRKSGSPPGKPAADTARASAAPSAPAAAAKEVELGRSAAGRGRWDTAMAHYHRALEHDPRSVGALAGLCSAHFETKRYPNAVRFCERASKRAPKNGKYRMALGDVYYRVFRYADARKQYAKAKDLGQRDAQARMDMIDKKQGG